MNKFPEFKLSHLFHLTDSAGMFQHARYHIPDRNHGYCSSVALDRSKPLLPQLRRAESSVVDGHPTVDDEVPAGLSLQHVYSEGLEAGTGVEQSRLVNPKQESP